MTDKKPGYQFTIFDQISENEKHSAEKYKQAIKDIHKQIVDRQQEIDSLRASDPDDEDCETRNEINAIERELRFLREEYNKLTK